MSFISRALITGATCLGLAVVPIGSSISLASSGTSNGLAYEFDNGTQWSLQKNPAAVHTTLPAGTTYSDAGIVKDMGPLAGLSASAGSSPFTVAGSGAISDNIWISTGPSEANTPGTHLLSSPVDFVYGFDNHNGTFWMASGAYTGQTLTLAQLQADYPNAEAYVWAGYVFTGANPGSASVSSVNGMSTGNRTMTYTANADGSTSVSLH